MNYPDFPVSNSVRIRNYWLPVLLMLIFQFFFSTNSFSSDETAGFVVPVLRILAPHLSWDGVMFWHHVVRKAAHVTEYCVLGVLVYRAFHLDVRNPWALRTLTAVFVAMAAMMDEFHQSYVPTRTSSIYDVGFDCFGGMIALVLIWIWGTARIARTAARTAEG